MNRLPKYCARCGSLLKWQHLDGRQRPVCSDCGYVAYLNPTPSVAAVLMREGRVLLVRRSIEPGRGRWSLPGGFIEVGETPEEAVVREVAEETGLRCRPLHVVDVQAVLGGFYGDIIVLCYVAEFVDGLPFAGDDADAIEEFPLDQLPPMAFDVHARFIQKCAGLRDDVETTA